MKITRGGKWSEVKLLRELKRTFVSCSHAVELLLAFFFSLVRSQVFVWPRPPLVHLKLHFNLSLALGMTGTSGPRPFHWKSPSLLRFLYVGRDRGPYLRGHLAGLRAEAEAETIAQLTKSAQCLASDWKFPPTNKSQRARGLQRRCTEIWIAYPQTFFSFYLLGERSTFSQFLYLLKNFRPPHLTLCGLSIYNRVSIPTES